jgi:hypothetical protein
MGVEMACSSKGKNQMNKEALEKTANKTFDYIRKKDYQQVRALFAPAIATTISNNELNKLTDQINNLVSRTAFPDAENIVMDAYKILYNNDSVMVYSLIYKFDNPSHSIHSYARAVKFNFLEQYGSEQLSGMHLSDDAYRIQDTTKSK